MVEKNSNMKQTTEIITKFANSHKWIGASTIEVEPAHNIPNTVSLFLHATVGYTEPQKTEGTWNEKKKGYDLNRHVGKIIHIDEIVSTFVISNEAGKKMLPGLFMLLYGEKKMIKAMEVLTD